VLAKAIKQRVPKLEHLEAGTSVREFIDDEPLGDSMSGSRIAVQDIAHLERVLGTTLSRLRRLHFKNLGALLRLQESLEPTLYADRATPEPDDSVDDSDEDEAE